jgi:hypothetical protein
MAVQPPRLPSAPPPDGPTVPTAARGASGRLSAALRGVGRPDPAPGGRVSLRCAHCGGRMIVDPEAQPETGRPWYRVSCLACGRGPL